MKRLTNATDRLAARWIPSTCNIPVFTHENGSAVYVSADGVYAIAYTGTAYRHTFHYSFKTVAQRDAYVAKFVAGIEASEAAKAERKAVKAAWKNPLTVGQVLYTSWGYDQTNTEFYVVTKVSGKKVTIAQIASTYEATGDMTGRKTAVLPVEIIGPEMVKIARANGFDGSASISINSYISAFVDAPGKAHSVSSYA